MDSPGGAWTATHPKPAGNTRAERGLPTASMHAIWWSLRWLSILVNFPSMSHLEWTSKLGVIESVYVDS